MRFIRYISAFFLLSAIINIFVFNTITFAGNDTEPKIPKIFIDGDISGMSSKSDKRKVKFKYEDDTQSFESYAKIKLQGSLSLLFKKKNYTIDFYSDNSYQKKNNVDFGWGNHSKYTLKANLNDKTNARNIVTANIAADANSKFGVFSTTPNYGETDGFPVEVYVNENYFGLYTLNIPKSDWMFGIDKENPSNAILSSDTWGESNLFRETIDFNGAWDFEVGGDEGRAVSQINKAIDFVAKSTDVEFKDNLKNYFDLDNLLNYYVLVEFAELADNTGKNIVAVTYNGSQWLLSLYDLDISWGAYLNQAFDYRASSKIEDNALFKRLRENFPNELADRYFALRKTILTKENILNKFYEFEAKIPQSSIEKDKEKWGEPMGYDLSQIEEFLDARIPYTDQFFYNLYTIKPEVSLKYETDKNNSFTKVTIIANREDIVIDGLTDDHEITFYENGFQEVSCHDWLNNYNETFNIEVDSIVEQKKDKAPLFLVCFISILACIVVAFVGAKFTSLF